MCESGRPTKVSIAKDMIDYGGIVDVPYSSDSAHDLAEVLHSDLTAELLQHLQEIFFRQPEIVDQVNWNLIYEIYSPILREQIGAMEIEPVHQG